MSKIMRYILLFTIILGIVYYVWPENKLEQNQRIALVYNDEKGIPSNRTPTSIGYGSSVEPLPGEPNRPCKCEKNWKYSFMYHTLPRTDYELNNELSRNLILRFRKHLDNKIYFEPHLILRFKLKGNYGPAKCRSVRHDDHFHVTLCKE